MRTGLQLAAYTSERSSDLSDDNIVNLGDLIVKTDACAVTASNNRGAKDNNMMVLVVRNNYSQS